MSNVLIIRISSIGDVAMTIPVVYSVAEANPQDRFTVLTHTTMMPLFVHHPQNVKVIGTDIKASEKSFFRFLQFALQLKKQKYDTVIDLHGVLRSWIVDVVFKLNGKKVYTIDKQRRGSKQITARPPKKILQLQTVVDRYTDVFRAAGFRFDVQFVSLFDKCPVDETIIKSNFGEKTGHWIGIAPFARHKGKIYPIEQMEKVVSSLSKRDDTTLFLFGGSGEESAVLSSWKGLYPNTVNVSGRFSIEQELSLLNRLDVMVSMDSANMHLASLAGIKVISIWGATHPYTGFYGYRQHIDLAIQADLPCRPCSIYGNKHCYRGDWACMLFIRPEQVVGKIDEYLSSL